MRRVAINFVFRDLWLVKKGSKRDGEDELRVFHKVHALWTGATVILSGFI